MPGSLVSIDAWNRRTSTRVTVRAGAALNSTTLGAGGYTWEPALRRAPRLSMQLADADLTGTVQVGQGQFGLKIASLMLIGDPRDLDWVGSPVRIYSGDGADFGRFSQQFVGRITGGSADANTGIASITVEADKAIINVPLLTLTYGGGGGIDGDVELRGNNIPAGFGSPINVPPILINAVANIYHVDGYGNTTGISAVYENLASFGPSSGDYATYAALAAATVVEGTWATCIAQGLFRLGAPPTGTITCDPVFGYGLPGSMMVRWLTTHAGVAASRIRQADFDALTAAVQAKVGAVPTVSFWTADTSNVLDLMQRVCASCNAVPLMMLDGTVGVTRCIGGNQVVTLNRQGGVPPVTSWQTNDPPVPWWRIRMTAARAVYVNAATEIDYVDTIDDEGDYSSTATYRQGMVVRGGDGARYIYTNATPTSGNTPPNVTYWDVYEDAPDATQVKYPSGYTLAQKEPQEKGANVTETRTAASIAAQGALATQSAVAYGGPYVSGFNALAAQASISLGSPYLFQSNGSTRVTDISAITALGTAAAIASQGAFATVSQAAYGSALLTGFAALATQASILLNGSYLFRQDGTTKVTDSNAITSLGTAAAISGQSPFATTSININRLSRIQDDGFVEAHAVYDSGGTGNLFDHFPAERGANITETRTSAAIVGQAPTATSSDFAVVTGATRPSNNATNDINLVALGNNPPIIVGNTVYGQGNNTSWPSYASSQRAISGGARAKAKIASGTMLGLSVLQTPSSPTATYTSLDYAVYSIGGHWYVFSTGNNVFDLGTGYTDDTIWECVFDGVSMFKLYANNLATPVYTNAYIPTGPVYLGLAQSSNTVSSGLTFAPYADVTRNNTAGAITGQGSLATLSQVTFNTTTIRRADGTTIVSETLVVTSLGTAAAIAGQAATATSSDFGAVTGTTKPADNATADLTFVSVGPVPVSVRGNRITGGGGGAAWQGYAISSTAVSGPLQINGYFPVTNAFIGFSQTASPGNPTYPSIYFGIHRSSDGTWSIWHLGAVVLGFPAGSFTASTKWQVTHDGAGVFKVYADGIVQTTQTYASPGALYGAVAIDGVTYVDKLAFTVWGDVTAANTAAAIVGQGKGATANTLGQLDPAAAAQLANSASSQTTVRITDVGNSQVITRQVVASGVVSVSGRVKATNNNQFGTLALQLQYATTPGSWVNFGSVDNETVGPGEPAFSASTANYTNTGTVTIAVDFRAVVSAPGGTVTDPSNSFLTA